MARKSNRREFLQTTAAVAGVGFFSSVARSQDSKSPNERIRFGCIGIGGKGSSDTGDATKHGDVVAVCDVDGKQLENASKNPRLKEARQFQDYRKMLDELGQSIDAVTVSTPDHTHAVAAAKAMRMGKHCFCQKPLTHDIWEARKLAEIAREMKVATQMGNQGTAGNPLREAAAIVKSGALGAIKEVHVWTNRPIWPQGEARPTKEQTPPPHVNWEMFLGPAPYRPYADIYHPFKWRGWWDFGTGALGDMACHTFNMPYMGLDLKDPTSVQATTSGHNRDSYPKWSRIVFEFPATEHRGAIPVTWYDGGELPPKEVAPLNAKGQIDSSGAVIVGEKGRLWAQGDYCGSFQLIGIDKPEVQFEKSPGHFEEWVAAIKGGKPAKSNFPEYAGGLTETILLGNLAVWAAPEANTPGKKVEWNAKDMKPTNAPELEEIVKREYRAGYEL